MEKKEIWRNQTLVNRDHCDSQILVEYYSLINFIKENYKDGRFEVIQCPCLHLISHSIELFYKMVLERACDYHIIALKKESFIHCHDICDLKDYVLKIFDFLSNEPSCSSIDQSYFKTDFVSFHNSLCNCLQSSVATYRYAFNRNRKGEVLQHAIPFQKDVDSPNMLEVFDLFEKCYTSLSYTDFVLDSYCIDE